MPKTLYDSWVSLMAGCAALSLLASLAFLIRALIDWRGPARNRRLAWFGLLAAAPFVTTAVHLGMLLWVHGPDGEPARQGRVLSGIAATLVPVVLLLFGSRLSRHQLSGGRNLAPFALAAAVPFILSGIHAALLFRVHLPGVARQSTLANQKRVDDVTVIRTGSPAPAFHLRTDDNATFDLSGQRGKVVLINFFATWCGPCLSELPLIDEVWEEHQHRNDFALLVIGRDETSDDVVAFRDKHQFTFPMAADPRGEVFSLFAHELIPRTFLIDRDGNVRLALTGFSRKEFAELRRVLDEELNHTP